MMRRLFALECDRCETSSEASDVCGPSARWVRMRGREIGWRRRNNADLCPVCASGEEEQSGIPL